MLLLHSFLISILATKRARSVFLACVFLSWDWSVDFALLSSIELEYRTATTVLEHRILLGAEGRAHLNSVGCYLPIRRGYLVTKGESK